MTAHCNRRAARNIPPYFVVMQDFGARGLEGYPDPTLTREDIIGRLASGEYDRVVFIHYIADGLAEDVTHELIEAAEQAARAKEMA